MSTANIAIVDDDESVRRAMARLIEAYSSFQVRIYASGREFLDSLKIGVPNCLIVDLRMNDMTGLQLLHSLAGMGLRIPAIVATADDEPGMRHRCKLAGAVAFLVKPVMSDPLLNAIKTAMSATEHGDARALGPDQQSFLLRIADRWERMAEDIERREERKNWSSD
jgi:FixJ family two-component response regulator